VEGPRWLSLTDDRLIGDGAYQLSHMFQNTDAGKLFPSPIQNHGRTEVILAYSASCELTETYLSVMVQHGWIRWASKERKR